MFNYRDEKKLRLTEFKITVSFNFTQKIKIRQTLLHVRYFNPILLVILILLIMISLSVSVCYVPKEGIQIMDLCKFQLHVIGLSGLKDNGPSTVCHKLLQNL